MSLSGFQHELPIKELISIHQYPDTYDRGIWRMYFSGTEPTRKTGDLRAILEKGTNDETNGDKVLQYAEGPLEEEVTCICPKQKT